MANPYFRFKQFTVQHDRCAMKVTTDACLFGAWTAAHLQNMQVKTLLDIGTGTGLLALMIAQKSALTIDAVELDPNAAGQAAENVLLSPWPDRIQVIGADILQFDPGKKYDVVIGNPPFYENELTGRDAGRNRAHHSSDLTLAQVIDQLEIRMDDGGSFFLLLPFKRRREAETLLASRRLFLHETMIVQPVADAAPFRIMLRGGREKAGMVETRLDIRTGGDVYTQGFTELLRDYYLYL